MKTRFELKRAVKLTNEEFTILVLNYPIYLVATADGHFDDDEKELLSTVLYNFLNPLYGDKVDESGYKNLIDNYLEDFSFLNLHESEFKLNLLEELKAFDIDVKKSISELLNEIASISEGIAPEEKEMIDFLNQNYLLNR
jgi:hypothetical protein